MQSCARISKDTVSICGGCMEVKVDRNPALDEGVGHGGSLMCLDPAADVGVCHGGSLMCHGPPDAGADYGDSFMCHDPAIKLFGRDIPLVSALATCIKSEGELTKQQTPAPIASIVQLSGLSCQQDSASDAPSAEDKEGVGFVSNDLGSSSGCNEVYEEENLNQSSSGIDCSMPDGEVSHGHLVHDKVIKKPDKLIPCPRCNSMETKFCYFNNYNVNQPRHFCKKCQRYWTAGGTLRNVPVGAGRRKSKHSMSHHKSTRHGTGIVQGETSDLSLQKSCSSVESTSNQLIGGLQQSRLQALPLETCSLATVDTPARSILSFGQENPLCRSVAGTSLSIHQSLGMHTRGVLQGQNMSVSDMNMNKGCSSRASIPLEGHIHKGVAEPSCTPLEKKPVLDELGYCSSVIALNTGKQVSGICGGTLGAEENPIGNHAIPKEEHPSVNVGAHQCGAIMNQDGPLFKFDTDRGSITPSLPPVAWPPSGGHWTGVSWPLMPMTMWGPPSDYAPFPWNMTWGPAAAAAMAAAAAALTGSAPPNTGLASSPIRKHKLEGSQSEPGSDGCLWVPKTLRVHDPIEAARSSIWATLGLGDGPKVGDAENIFCFKSGSKVSEDPAPHPQHGNPAALSRSMTFQESR